MSHILKNSSYQWPGDIDLRNQFDTKYLQYFKNVYTSINTNYDKYDLIITDDNRQFNGLSEIYQRKKCLVLACSHGVTEHDYETKNVGKSYDRCFVFGRKEVKHNHQIPIGIPANDILKTYSNIEKKHILVIINYLGHEGQISTGNGTELSFAPDSIVVDPWRKTPNIEGVKVIHYGNTRGA